MFSSKELESFAGAMEKAAFKKRWLHHREFFQDMPVSIEYEKGGKRVSSDGKWSTDMKAHYGYLRGTRGVDGDEVDVYVGDDAEAKNAYIVHQLRYDGERYDEDKVILGVSSKEKAEELYLEHMPKKYLGSISVLPIDQFKRAMMSSWRRPHRITEDSGRKRTPDIMPSKEWERVARKLEREEGR